MNPHDPRNDSGVRSLDGVSGLHKTPALIPHDGFEQIVSVAIKMNPSGKRKYSGSDNLNSLRSGERIVCATRKRGIREVPTCTNGVTT